MERFDSKDLAGLHFDPSMKANKTQDEIQQGLSETHEQVMNYLMDGTVDSLIEK